MWNGAHSFPAVALFVVIYIATVPAEVCSQLLPIEVLTLEQGLPSSYVVDLAQDPSGRLWILDRRGLTLYDGTTFHSYPQPEDLLPTRFGALAIDSEGDVWVSYGSSARVFRMEGDLWHPLPSSTVEPSTDAAVFLSVVRHPAGAEVISATGNRIRMWHQSENGTFSAPQSPDGDEISKVWAMTPFGHQMAIGSPEGLCFLGLDGRISCQSVAGEPNLKAPVFGLTSESTAKGIDRLWILSGIKDRISRPVDVIPARLSYLQEGELFVVAEHPAFPLLAMHLRQSENFKIEMLADSAGSLYLGNAAALYFLDQSDRSLTEIGLKQGLPSTGAASLALDPDHGVWVGTPRGLSRIGGRRFISFNAGQGLLEDEVTAIAEPFPGRIILGHNLGFTVLEGESVIRVPFDRPRGTVQGRFRVFDLAVDVKGNVWAATSRSGLWLLNRELELERKLPEVRNPRSLAFDPEGRLWLMAFEGIYLLTPDGFELVHEPPGLERARWLEFDQKGRFLITTSRGLTVLEPDGQSREVRIAGTESNNLFGVLKRPSGEVWVGSTMGLLVLRDGELTQAEGVLSQIDGPVYFLLDDPQGRIWLGTDDGVRIWDGSELRTLTTRHGLVGRETNRGGGLVDHRGRVWVGTDRGASVYQAAYDFTLPAPVLELLSLEADGRSYGLDQPLNLEHFENNLSVNFRITSFSREEALLLSYRLEGLEDFLRTPLPATVREVAYNNLSPGTYRFHIRVGRENGRWTEERVSPPIVISRPMWRTYPFYGAVLLLTFGTAVVLFRLRTRAVRIRALRAEAVNEQLRHAAEDKERLIASLEAKNVELERFTYTVSHDLKSPLLNIRGFLGFLEEALHGRDFEAMESDIASIDRASKKMVQLLDELLELARIGQALSSSERICLSTLFGQILELSIPRLREREITTEVELEVAEVSGDPIRLRMVFQNLVDNAIRFTYRQEKPHIEIRAVREGDDILISVADNGVGIPEEQQKQVFGLFKRLDSSVPGTGVGLALVHRIVEAHGGKVWVESDGPDQGSRFVVRLPRTAD